MAGKTRGRIGGGELVALVVVGVFAVIVAFWLLSFIAGFVWAIVKLAIVVALVALVLRLLVGRRR
jgi:hypothetical protein